MKNILCLHCCLQLFFMLVVQAYSLLPARAVLTHPAMKPLCWAFQSYWPAPKLTEGLMVYDLPPWVFLPHVLLLWLPTQASIVILLLWTTGVIGGAARLPSALVHAPCRPFASCACTFIWPDAYELDCSLQC